MNIPFDQKLNIRQKLLFAFFAFLLSTSILSVISYRNLTQVEEKFNVVEAAYELSNIVLEIRRYEKNYFLFGREDDYKENTRFINETFDLLNVIRPAVKNPNQKSQLETIASELVAYRSLFQKIHGNASDPNGLDERTSQLMLRNSGQNMVNISLNFVAYERQLILKINTRLKNNILISTSLILLLGILVIFFIIWKVIRPLNIIESSTRSIAKGKFEKVAVWNTKDEIQKVMIAFNQMVDELKKRQNQLVQAQKLSSIGTLASGIAHQVNNPLNNISTSCQILMEDFREDCSDMANKMMTNIESETFRARDIVRGLLEFSRNQEFVLRESRLMEVVDRSIKLVSSQIPSGIEILKQIPDDIVLNLDLQRMQEVFINLLMNAVHAISPESGKVSIVGNKDEPTKTVTILVEDTGQGIPETIRNRIFDPFFTTKDVGSGTGLGLYLVYGIIQQHNGSIRLGKMMREGTKFIIKLPMGRS
ncbi:MAG: HAMP domain-containing histidine kinase [Proteobacteria bacterium]|nr:HAMP domain-containing histidine kinase [Pseudomonadota bacterium]